MKTLSKLLLLICIFLCISTTKTYAAYTYNWTGGTSTVWELAANWSRTGSGGTSTYPGQGGSTTDIVQIGITTSYTNQPTLATSVGIVSLTIGTLTTTTLTINGALTLTGDFTQKNNANGGGVTTNLTGTGSIACNNFFVGDPTTPPAPLLGLANQTYLTTVNFTSLNLTVNQNLYLTTTSAKAGLLIVLTVVQSADVDNPIFNFNSGTISVGKDIQTIDSNDANLPGLLIFPSVSSSSQFLMNPATSNTSVLNLSGANPLSLDGNAGYVDFFGSAGGTSTVNYSGTVNQEVYTASTPYSFTRQSPTGLDRTTSVYQNLTFSGSQTKASDVGTLSVGNNFTLAAGSEIVDLATNSPTVTIGGNLLTSTGTAINQGGTGTMAIAGTSANSGTINQTGSGNITFTGAVNNAISSAIIAQTGSGAITASGGFTNSGTYSQGSGIIGGITVTGAFTNSGTVTQTSGNVTVNGDVTNSGTLGLGSANLTISGNYTNSGTYTQSTGTTLFNGAAAETLQGGSGAGTQFNTINFSGAGLKSMTTGNFSVSSTSVLTMVGSSSLAAGGNLTLLSDSTGSATVATIPTGASITGNVNVQRYLSGGKSYSRGYRLMSSPVTQGSGDYSINYLINSAYLTGTTGTAGGFDKAGNPTIYLYRENLAPLYTTFLNSNFRAINTISGSPNYLIDSDPGTFNIPVGNGYLFFFRGNRSSASLAAETTTTYVATSATFTATGVLNQGQVTVKDWYTPGSINLGYTLTAGNAASRGLNLAGNPYASSINWDTYSSTVTTSPIYAPSVTKFIYVFDVQSKNYGVYAAGTPSKTGTDNSTNIIASGQGFFVKDTCSCGRLIINESAKVNTQVTGLNLLMTRAVNSPIVDQHLRLQMAMDTTNIDEMIVSFNDSAKATYVPWEDAPYYGGQGLVSLASITPDNKMLTFNELPLPKQTADTIRLTVGARTDGIYQLNMKELIGIPQPYEIWLMDNYRKDSLDMRSNEIYSFNIYHADSTSFGGNRFKLIIRQNPALAYRLLNFAANKMSNAVQVKLSWKTQFEQNYTSFTVQRSIDSGKTYQVIGSVMPSNGQENYGMIDKNPVIGQNLYRLKQEYLSDNATYSNLVPILYANTGNTIFTSNINVYPNPAINVINLSIIPQSPQTASYNITVTSSSGIVVSQVVSKQPTWQDNVSDLLPGTYVIRVTNDSNNSLVGETKFVKM